MAVNALILQAELGQKLPSLVTAADNRAQVRFLEFFVAAIRNPHTRRAYARATLTFLSWCEARGVASLAAVQPLHVAAWIEALGREVSAPTVKQQLAGIRHLFDWLVVRQVEVVPPDLAPAERLPWLIGSYQRKGIRDEGRSKGALDA